MQKRILLSVVGAVCSLGFIASLAAAQSSYDGFSFTEPNSFPSTIGGAPLEIPCGHAQQVGLFDDTGYPKNEDQPLRGLANEKNNAEKSPVTQPPEDDPLAFDPCR